MSEIVDIGLRSSEGKGVLVGSKVRKFDKQSRLLLNAAWRHVFGCDVDGKTRVYLAPGVTSDGVNCVDVIPGRVVGKRYAFLDDVPEDDPIRAHMEVLFKSMKLKEVDIQGRVGIPEILKAHAGIKDNVMMVGAGDCIKVTMAADDANEEAAVDFDAFRKSRIALAELRKKKP